MHCISIAKNKTAWHDYDFLFNWQICNVLEEMFTFFAVAAETIFLCSKIKLSLDSTHSFFKATLSYTSRHFCSKRMPGGAVIRPKVSVSQAPSVGRIQNRRAKIRLHRQQIQINKY